MLTMLIQLQIKNKQDQVHIFQYMNQKANLKKVIIKLSKRKDATRVMNNKKKLKSMKPQNIGLPSGCKIYINESLCKYYKYLW